MARQRKMPSQQALPFKRWGGRREGAGRKRDPNSGVPHLCRPRFTRHLAGHATLKLIRELRGLRTKRKAHAIRRAIAAACGTKGFRIVDWSIQRDHVHLMVEADSTKRLSRGMQGLVIRIARGLNRTVERSGRVFADRYHLRVLTTPQEVRNCRAYVLNNHRRHTAQRGIRIERRWLDPFSSAAWFDGWKDCPQACRDRARDGWEDPPPVDAPRSWLMRVGWQKANLIRIDEVPLGCTRR